MNPGTKQKTLPFFPGDQEKTAPTKAKPHKNVFHVYTDGACQGNPGPMGIGVVVIDGQSNRQEWGRYLGMGTNNIAELTAISDALERLPHDASVHVYTDSSYSIGVLTKNWKLKFNQELIAGIRKKISSFKEVRFVKVPGHSGVPDNERCDELAREAIRTKSPLLKKNA